MQSTAISAYQQLKQAVAKKLCDTYPDCPRNLSDWKGQVIATFQEELTKSVNGRVSEKWFYTHLKPTQIQKLPRTDMLDLLSRFVGYEDWNSFQESYTKTNGTVKPSYSVVKNMLWAVIITLIIGCLLYIQFSFFVTNRYQYNACVIDGYLQKPVDSKELQVFWLKHGESPMQLTLDKGTCFSLETEAPAVLLVLKAPYYKTDTIIRTLGADTNSEKIRLMPDDYALMIHYFSNAKLDDWKKHKEQLQEMFANNARIFQVDDSGLGMELYNKEEFINKLTIPLNSLRNIRILETLYDDEGKIRQLRFIQEER